ncbi:MAG: hypothetical protein C6W54_17720 [Bacillaceae bacterium]|nr:MAG: hypothetical protein C6W54_17720 [Bacillaceae bacterium]
MIRKKINIDVVSTTWTMNGKSPPISLAKLSGKKDINILLVMIHIAIRTRPPLSYGFTLGDIWAWLRYFPAISTTTELRLKPEWEEIDSHQKTILSDDWGVGFSSCVLTEALNLIEIIPTNYLVSHSPYFSLGSAGGKTGPRKSPDFIGVDRSGRFHIFECKGTQSSIDSMRRQFETGRIQKNNVNDPCSLIDQRLVVGLFVPQYRNPEEALLRIEDPEFEIDLGHIENEDLIKTILIGNLATYFHLLGFPKIANAIALNKRLEDKFEKRTREEIESLSSVFIDQKEYKLTKMIFKFDYSDQDNSENSLYRLEVKFGIEKSVVENIFHVDVYSEYIDEIYNHFEDIQTWKINEYESGISVITPLGLYAEINIIY